MSSRMKPEVEEEIEEEIEGVSIKKTPKIIIIVSVAWVLFQLAIPQLIILDTLVIRAVHLAFALTLAFLTVNLWKRPTTASFKKPLNRILYYIAVGVFFALILAATCYIIIDWNGIAERAGVLLTRDMLIGVVLIALLLEATRRKIGMALVLTAEFFIVYALFASHFPGILAFRDVSVMEFFNQTTLSFEGIYGIPLGISASTIFLFVFMGALLERAGAARYFINLALALVGRSRGGPAKAAVASSAMIGTISGSSIANVATSGMFTIPLMKKAGFPSKKAAAIEVAASTDGQLMPPIMGAAAFIMAEYINVPYVEIVKAAIVPAVISLASLFFVVHFEASKLGIQKLAKEHIPRFTKILWSGAHYLAVIGVLLYELLVLRHSPEMSVYKAVLLLLVIILLQELWRGYRKKSIPDGIKNAWRIIIEGCILGSKNMVMVALATAVAGIIVGVINLGLGSLITQIVGTMSLGNIFLLLLFTAFACIILGMGLPTTATYIVMASLTVPIIVEFGADVGFVIPLIAAHLFCFYFGILADDTPPVGVAAYTAATIAKSDPIKTGLQSFMYDIRDAIIPFMFILNTDLILYNIENFWLGLLIAGMGILGALTFTSALQGWLLIKNKWYENIFCVGAALFFLNPAFITFFIDIDIPYYGYIVGLTILALVAYIQTMRRKTV